MGGEREASVQRWHCAWRGGDVCRRRQAVWACMRVRLNEAAFLRPGARREVRRASSSDLIVPFHISKMISVSVRTTL